MRFIARIALEILVRSELCGIDEQRDDDESALRARGPEERQVPFVERAHRGNETDRSFARQLANLADGAEHLHRAVASASTS